jgi:hypothetical protein
LLSHGERGCRDDGKDNQGVMPFITVRRCHGFKSPRSPLD